MVALYYSGAWPGCDMIPLGRISLKNDPRYSRLTKMSNTLMALFSIFRSPLMFGGNLPDNNAFTDSLLTNPDVLYVNQHSTNNRQLYNRDDVIAWTADDTGSDDKFWHSSLPATMDLYVHAMHSTGAALFPDLRMIMVFK